MTGPGRTGRGARAVRAVAFGGAAALLLAGTAACGGSDDGGDGDGTRGAARTGTDPAVLAAVRAAADSAERTTSAAFDASLTGPGAEEGGVTAEGTMSWGDDQAIDATVHGDALGLGPAVPDDTRVLWADDTLWASLGDAFAAEFDGRDWLRLDLAGLDAESGGADGGLAGAVAAALDTAAQDPAEQLALLLRSPGIESAGTEEIDGVEAEHYRGTVPVDEALSSDAASGESGGDRLTDEQRRRLAEAAERQGIEEWTIDVWVGEDDFPVRLRQEYTTSQGEVTYQVDYDALGTGVAVEPPPADRAVDFAEVLERFASGLGG